MQKKIKLILIFAAAFFLIQPAISEVDAGLWDKFKSFASKAASKAKSFAKRAAGAAKKAASKMRDFASRAAHSAKSFAKKAAGKVRNFASKYGSKALAAAKGFHNSPLGQMVEQQALDYGMQKMGVSAGMRQNVEAVAAASADMNQQAADSGESFEEGQGPGDVYQSAMSEHHQAHESLHRAQEYQQAAQDAYASGDQDSAQQYMQMHQHHMQKHHHHMQQYEAHQAYHQQRFPNQQWPGHELGYGPDQRAAKAPAENFEDEGYGQDYQQDTFNQNFGSGAQTGGGGEGRAGYDEGEADDQGEQYEQDQQDEYER